MKIINGKTFLSIEDYVQQYPPIPKGGKVKTKLGQMIIVGYSANLEKQQFSSWKYSGKMYNKEAGTDNPIYEFNSSDIL